MTPAAKRCPRCTHFKSRDAFYERPERKNGLSSWCISCHRAYPDPPPDLPGATNNPLMAYLKNRRKAAAARTGVETVPCAGCGKELARLDYSKSQWRDRQRKQPTCLDCQAAARRARADELRRVKAVERRAELLARGVDVDRKLICRKCGDEQTVVHFSEGEWAKEKPTCRRCVAEYQRHRAEIRQEEARSAQFHAQRAEEAEMRRQREEARRFIEDPKAA